MNAAAAWENWEGQVVDEKFPLLQWLGGSQRSAVFRTELPGPQRQKAAIKIISSDAATVQRQLDCWQLAASLSHPQLLRILAFGRCQISGSPRMYVVTELAEEDLSQVLPVRPLTTQESTAMLTPMVAVLSYVHQKGLVHGRIKPSNIMATAEELKLSSDSLRRIGETDAVAAQPTAYDAPEIATSISTAADIWSLGATLVAVFTQYPPAWKKSDPAEFSVPKSIPGPFYNIARGCLRRDPNDRITLEQIRGMLQPAKPVTESRPKSTGPTRTRPRLAVAVSIVLACVLAVFAVRWAIHGTQQTPAKVSAPAPVSDSVRPPASASLRVPGEVLERIDPDVSASARHTIQGKIKVAVRVAVDPSGKVSEAALTSAGPSRYFANKAIEAAQRWKFKPAEVGGQPVASQWLLRFQFGQSKTEVFPTPVDH